MFCYLVVGGVFVFCVLPFNLPDDGGDRYVTAKPWARAGLVVAYDIFGFDGQSRIRSVCDRLAEAGFFVILPDFYRGQQWTDARMESEGHGGLKPFIQQFKWDGALDGDFELFACNG